MTELLRRVSMPGTRFILETWEAPRWWDRPQTRLGYRLISPGRKIIFEGDDFGCSPLVCIDSDECLRHILGFLTLRPGDVEADYFEDYTEVQKEFCAHHAETLSMWALEPTSDCRAMKFRNLMRKSR